MKRHAKKLQNKSRKHEVILDGHMFRVESGKSGKTYFVRPLPGDRFQCSCEWAKNYPHKDCSHTLAVREWLANAANNTLSFWATEEDAKRQHRHIERLGYGLLATERRPNRKPVQAERVDIYEVLPGKEVLVRRNGSGWKPFTTKRVTHFSKPKAQTESAYIFEMGTWELMIEKEQVNVV
jgi:hypothetical protein